MGTASSDSLQRYPWVPLSASPSIGCLRGNLSQKLGCFCMCLHCKSNQIHARALDAWKNHENSISRPIHNRICQSGLKMLKKPLISIHVVQEHSLTQQLNRFIHPQLTWQNKSIILSNIGKTNSYGTINELFVQWITLNNCAIFNVIQMNHCGYTSASKLSHSSFRSRACCIQRSAASSSPSWDEEKQGMTCKATV